VFTDVHTADDVFEMSDMGFTLDSER